MSSSMNVRCGRSRLCIARSSMAQSILKSSIIRSSMSALPAVPEAFYWTHESWGAALRCRRLERVAPHVFTSRQLALSERSEAEVIGEMLQATRVAMLTQVHGNAVVAIRAGARQADSTTRPEADALVSDDASAAIA